MNELIKLERRDGKNTVNARDLWEFLGSKRQFGNWIKERIERYDFIEGKDFLTILLNRSTTALVGLYRFRSSQICEYVNHGY